MIVLVTGYLLYFIQSLVAACNPSATTVKGSFTPSTVCSGHLIFEENFDSLDQTKWWHEITLASGGNNEFQW